MMSRRSRSRFAALVLGLLGLGGCAEPCDDLQRICERCVDPNQRASCEAFVDRADNDTCLTEIDVFTNVCD